MTTKPLGISCKQNKLNKKVAFQREGIDTINRQRYMSIEDIKQSIPYRVNKVLSWSDIQ